MKKLIGFVGAVLLMSSTLNAKEAPMEEDVTRACARATLSCGVTGWACGETVMEMIENAIAADEAIC